MFRPRYETMRHLKKENPSLLCCKRQTSFDFQHSFITDRMVERCSVSLQTGEVSYVFPLYIYPESNEQINIKRGAERSPNLSTEVIKLIAQKLGITFTLEKEPAEETFAPIDILDYIYAVLHSPSYREKYKEFLKIDFPRVPYPENKETFWKLVKLGGEIRQIHLLESPEVNEYITQYPIDGDNIVTRIKFELNYEIIEGDDTMLIEPVYPMGRVYINDTQYFQMVPEVAWNFYIGGYQPAQKWLKDRKGRELGFEDILHYQKIIVALKRTDELMKEIDLIEL
jgi:predicted helicase